MDPAQHSWTVLAAFIESLTGSEWAQLLDRRIAWERQAVEVRSRNCVLRLPSALLGDVSTEPSCVTVWAVDLTKRPIGGRTVSHL